MTNVQQPSIRDLAVIGDKQSCALIDKEGTVAWYCLWRFDQPSLFSLLIDEQGGYWAIEAAGKSFTERTFRGNTAILDTTFSVDGGRFVVTDFMPFQPMRGICRMVSASPVPVTLTVHPTPHYNRATATLHPEPDGRTVSDKRFEYYVRASHPLRVEGGRVAVEIPAGEEGWCVLLDDARGLRHCTTNGLQNALSATAQKWQRLMANITYEGVYKKAFHASYKAIQLMTHESSGGILAAGTTSLPEAIGDRRNYDYRYVWLRDTAMNVSALVRARSAGGEAGRFLDFLCTARATNKADLFVPFYDLDNKTAPDEDFLPGSGYRGSRPIRIGNGAYEQLQLDGQGNVLLAAKQVYAQRNNRPHWKMIVRTANYLVQHWQEKDHGIWEESRKEHFTSSKVLAAKSLEFIAEYADDKTQKETWLTAARNIRHFVAQYCMTMDGAYAVFAGSNDVDITAALYPVWLYDAPDAPAMVQTVRRLEENYLDGELYRRHLLETAPADEGVFLAASLWMAQYYVLCKRLDKAKAIIDAVLAFSTDLFFLPEEGDIESGEPLGNIPQTFVHASLMGAILDYNEALGKKG